MQHIHRTIVPFPPFPPLQECVLGSQEQQGHYLKKEELPEKGVVDSLGTAPKGVLRDGRVYFA